jgi:hypothetical protein
MQTICKPRLSAVSPKPGIRFWGGGSATLTSGQLGCVLEHHTTANEFHFQITYTFYSSGVRLALGPLNSGS